jgi:hypothetical protein
VDRSMGTWEYQKTISLYKASLHVFVFRTVGPRESAQVYHVSRSLRSFSPFFLHCKTASGQNVRILTAPGYAPASPTSLLH